MDDAEKSKKMEFLDQALDYEKYLNDRCLDEKYRPDTGKILAQLFHNYIFK